MKYLIRRAFIDVGWLLVVIICLYSALVFVTIITNDPVLFSTLMKWTVDYCYYWLGILVVFCAIWFTVSLVRNLISVGQHLSTSNYSFDSVAEAIGKNPDVFENWDC